MKEYLKEKKGITLVALVVTIVVLLILASISIGILGGDDGVIKRAQESKDKTEQSELEEDVDVAYIEYEGQLRKSNNLEYYLNKIQKANVEKVAEDTWYVTRGNAKVTVSEDGEKQEGRTEIWDGTSIDCPEFKEFNWYIYTPGQLKFLADFVNNANTITTEQETIITSAGYRVSDVTMTESTIVYLMNNLDLGARPVNGNWETTANEAKKWTPIGIDKDTKKFIGTFEGNNHSIKGVYVNSTKSDAGHGLFGNSSTIQNLTIGNSYIKGGTCTGGIVGALRTGKVENCHNKNTKVILKEDSSYNVGGVVGQASTGTNGVFNCTNTGNVIAYGIYPYSGVNLQCIGGVVGLLLDSAVISGCFNKGLVTGYNDGECVGGIAGNANPNSVISQCTNTGAVTGSGKIVGGIAGGANINSTISQCTNSGAVTGSGERVGGIVGKASTNSAISQCTNSGAVTGSVGNIGGIAGIIFGTVEKSVNNGTIKRKEGTDGLGGVVGQIGANCTAKIINCYNTGKVIEEGNNTNAVGGIVGRVSANNTQGEISHNYNIGQIEIKGSSVTNVGGAIGYYTTTTFEINNNYYELNKSNVTLNELGEGKTAIDMKTQTFVDLLNLNQDAIVWELGSSNNGYPTLKKEE